MLAFERGAESPAEEPSPEKGRLITIISKNREERHMHLFKKERKTRK